MSPVVTTEPRRVPPDARRLFYALWLPADLVEPVGKRARLVAEHSRGRAQQEHQLHMTVHFLGPVLPTSVPAALAAGASVSSGPFDLTLDEMEFWPPAQVLCLVCLRPPPGLLALADQLRRATTDIVLRPDRRNFRPHVTLARRARRMPRLDRTVPMAWPVREFSLVESTPVRGGSRYETLATWPLAPAAPPA